MKFANNFLNKDCATSNLYIFYESIKHIQTHLYENSTIQKFKYFFKQHMHFFIVEKDIKKIQSNHKLIATQHDLEQYYQKHQEIYKLI